MKNENFLEVALKEEDLLVRRLAVVRAVISNYRGDNQHSTDQSGFNNAAPPKVRTSRRESTASQVVRVAEDFLKRIGRRAPSTQIYEEMKRLGLEIDTTNPAAVVASYLSNSDKFNNVRGQGYGLSIWHGHQPDEASSGETMEAS